MRVKTNVKAGDEATTRTTTRKLAEFYDYPVT